MNDPIKLALEALDQLERRVESLYADHLKLKGVVEEMYKFNLSKHKDGRKSS
jgi:hypothetical protein